MAIYRNVLMTFWTDSKVTDDFTPEDRYFYLYLFTNPHTNLCGCYEISLKQVANEMGYSKDSVENLIKRFENIHNVLKYSEETKEILLLNWHKYNWTNSEKFRKPLLKEILNIKCNLFRDYMQKIFDKDSARYGIDTNCIDTTDTVSDSVSVNNNIVNKKKDNIDNNIYINIISYLNNRCNTRYRYDTPNTKKHIGARIKEGYTEQDFYTVIDKKVNEWLGTERERYLRPDTLFGTKFESYLNQNVVSEKQGNQNFGKGAIDWDNV